jgi:hypothetical protein
MFHVKQVKTLQADFNACESIRRAVYLSHRNAVKDTCIMATISDPAHINRFRTITLKHALSLYAKTGMIPTRGVTATKMLKMAEEITGTKYKRGTHATAAADLEKLLESQP